jgi:KDO2-lipid IV(A) lauroyltransferase
VKAIATSPGQARIAGFLTAVNRSCARIIPLPVVGAISSPLSDAVRVAWREKAGFARLNYAQVLGPAARDEAVDRAVRDCFRHFGRYVAEMLSVQGWGNEDIQDRVTVLGERHFGEAANAGKGVVFVSAHMGSPEVAACMAVLKGFRITAVTGRVKPDWLMQYVVASRQRMGVTLVPASGAGIGLIRELRRGGMVAFVIDGGIDLPGSVPVTLFGRQTLFPEGPARLARLTGAPIVFAVAARHPGGRFTVHICPALFRDDGAPADEDIRAKTQQLASLFERFVRRYPGQWYAFREMWRTVTRERSELSRGA